MKRQLVEDLRTRLKVLQDGERSHRAQVEELEKKVRDGCGGGGGCGSSCSHLADGLLVPLML